MSINTEKLTNEQLRQIKYTYGGDYNTYDAADHVEYSIKETVSTCCNASDTVLFRISWDFWRA